MFKKEKAEIVEEFIEEIYDKGTVLSNYFTLDLDDIEYFKTEFSIVLRKTFTGFARLYFLTNNIEDLKLVLNQIEGTSVVNIPTKDDIKEFDNVMTSSGFSLFKIYEVYVNNESRGNDVFVDQFAKHEDFESVKHLLYSELDIFADHLPNDDELVQMIRNKQVLVNYENDIIAGVFIFSLHGKKCYFNYWVDTSKNGLFLIFNMYNFLKQKDITYAYLWVNTKNEKVKKIHKLFGCQPNNTKDYIYIKN